ncbi:MAG: phosphatidylserine decarboxylase family protein [Flavobacteriales bacterium]|nr:phosphatidylserine decarboxylase family protein [Flavobacteriales bacterium]
MEIHKEGYNSLILAVVVCSTISYATMNTVENPILSALIYSICGLCFFIVLQFFRSPQRQSYSKNNLIHAPADGEVVVIEEIDEAQYFNEKRIQVSIFMSPLNVHVNWYPISGTVETVKYIPGKHLVAWNPKSSTDNEMTNVIVKHANGMKILVKQIAGALARRIVYYSKEQDDVKQGDQIGFIKFGSRVDLILPASVVLNVKIGDKVTGSETVIAKFDS